VNTGILLKSIIALFCFILLLLTLNWRHELSEDKGLCRGVSGNDESSSLQGEREKVPTLAENTMQYIQNLATVW
jgi:hypothetical protein